ncbi:MAG: ParB N-terminal domain-containing protein [Thermoplasmatales archaeon]
MKNYTSELQPHRHQDLVLGMSNADYENLLNDIKRNGILQPIDITYDNIILDGHHRIRAAKELNIKEIEVRIFELVNINEDEYLISVALNRRHLTKGQKAMLALKHQKILSEKAVKEASKKANDVKYGHVSVSTDAIETEKKAIDSRKIAAEKFKISERKLQQANTIPEKAPEIAEKVMEGSLNFIEATVLAKQPKEIRNKAMNQKVEKPHKDMKAILKEINNETAISNPVPVPQGKFAVIYADPSLEV